MAGCVPRWLDAIWGVVAVAMIDPDTLWIPPIVWHKPEGLLAAHGTPARARYHLRHEGPGYNCDICHEGEARRVAAYKALTGKLGRKLGGRWPR